MLMWSSIVLAQFVEVMKAVEHGLGLDTEINQTSHFVNSELREPVK